MSILIIEDDPKVQVFLRENLENDFYPVYVTATLPQGTELKALSEPPTTVILDRLLGALDSKNFLPQLRKQLPEASIIVLSAINSPAERSEVLDLGADDYMGKPFSIVELKSRIRAHQRRSKPVEQSSYIRLGDTILDVTQRVLTHGDARTNLTAKEFELFWILARAPGKVHSKFELMDKVWNANLEIESNVLEVTIMHLRKKILEIGSSVVISSKRNVGYWLEA